MESIIVPMGQHNVPIMQFSTDFGKAFKALAMILHANFELATLVVAEQGLFIQESIADGSMIFECQFRAEKFIKYKTPQVKDDGSCPFFTLGFSCVDFKQAADTINKADSISLEIHPSNREKLFLIISKSGLSTVIEKSFALKATTIGQTVPPTYKDHLPTVTVTISDYKIAVTSLKKGRKNTLVCVESQVKGIRFYESTSQITTDGAHLGEWVPNRPVIAKYNIPLTRLISFAEVNTINPKETIRIYAFQGFPLRLSTDATSLGVMNMYLGSTNI